MTNLFALVGRREEVLQRKIGESFVTEDYEEIVALFTSEQKAKDYIKKSLLKQPKSRTFAGDKIFKSRTLLSNYQEAWVEDYSPPAYEIDPSI